MDSISIHPATKIMNKNLWLDDERKLPFRNIGCQWLVAKNYDEAVEILENNEIDVAFLDHDLAIDHYTYETIPTEKTGYDLVKWMRANKKFPKSMCYVHSANPVGADKMCEVLYKHYKTPYPGSHRVHYEQLLKAYREL